jgi:hypothetical protein
MFLGELFEKEPKALSLDTLDPIVFADHWRGI